MSIFNPSDVNNKKSGIDQKTARLVCAALGAASEANSYSALITDLSGKGMPSDALVLLQQLPWADTDFSYSS